MNESKPAGLKTAEKIAGIVAVVSALIVLNGAWENQHTFQNIAWRVGAAAVLLGLALIVELDAASIVQERLRRRETDAVPDFLLARAPSLDAPGDEATNKEQRVEAGERR